MSLDDNTVEALQNELQECTLSKFKIDLWNAMSVPSSRSLWSNQNYTQRIIEIKAELVVMALEEQLLCP